MKQVLWKVILPGIKKVEVVGNLMDIAKELQPNYQSKIIAVKINRQIYSLFSYPLDNSCSIKFVEYNDPDGRRIYQRSLIMLLLKAVYDRFPDYILSVEHSLGKGVYCELLDKNSKQTVQINQKCIDIIESQMNYIVESNISFSKKEVSFSDAVQKFQKESRQDINELLKLKDKEYISMYNLGEYEDYLFGTVVPNSSWLRSYKLHYYMPGLILQFPDSKDINSISIFEEQPRLFEVFRESQKWNKLLNVTTLADVNNCIGSNQIQDLVLVNEGLHEKKIAKIADYITEYRDRLKIILIAGPSSSGKTSFAYKLNVQLRVNGIESLPISVDDYFLERDQTPKNLDGSYDFESIHAVDIPQFNDDLMKLIQGESVAIPTYNFVTGRREYNGKVYKLNPYQPLIIEGIHCLNEKLTANIPKGNKYKIYVSALSPLNIDRHNMISTSDIRLLRRIIRDKKYRGNDAKKTISMWQAVRRGEEKNIFPFQEDADVMFNSTVIYELPLLKKYAEPVLQKITINDQEYIEAQRLLRFLSYVKVIPENVKIPCTSIIQEFIGGSCLN